MTGLDQDFKTNYNVNILILQRDRGLIRSTQLSTPVPNDLISMLLWMLSLKTVKAISVIRNSKELLESVVK